MKFLSARGHETRLSLEDAIEELDGIIRHYAEDRPVRLIGHSWGAMLCAAYIGRHPERVKQAVLAEPGALDTAALQHFLERTDASTNHPGYYWNLLRALMTSLTVDAPDGDAGMDYVYGKMTEYFVDSPASGYRCDTERIRIIKPSVVIPANRFGAAAYHALFGPDADLSSIAERAGNYNGDLLFMTSECSRHTGTEFQRRQMRLFPQATLVEIPDAGHNMFGENPERSLAEVRRFFAN